MVEWPLVYMHIPKTGGSSIDKWLYDSFAPKAFWYPSDYIRPQQNVTPDSDALVIVGHVPAWLKGTYITVLRDPVERVISLYYAHMHYGEFPFMGLDLEEFIVKAPYPEIDNGMTRRIAGGAPNLDKALRYLKSYAFVGTKPEQLVEWVENNIKLPNKVEFKIMNVNGSRPRIVSASTRQLIRELNPLDMQLWDQFNTT